MTGRASYNSLVFLCGRSAVRVSSLLAFLLGVVAPVGTFLSPILAYADHCHPPKTHHVRQVLDGDSFVLDDDRSVRLIGVNAPEYGKGGLPDQPLAREARRHLAQLVQGQCVRLVLEVEPTDRYGRILAHVFGSNGISVEESLIQQGLAWMIAISPNVAWTERLAASETQARQRHRGVWSVPDYRPVAAESLDQSQAGFRIVEGIVRRINKGRHAYDFELTTHTWLLITVADWKRYFDGDPARFLNRRIVVRGWLSPYRDGLRMRVHHPAMLTFSR